MNNPNISSYFIQTDNNLKKEIKIAEVVNFGNLEIFLVKKN